MNSEKPKAQMLTFTLLAVLLWPAGALAHLVNTGIGPVYDGIGHLLLSPGDMVPVIALSLLAGVRGQAAGRMALFVLPIAWLVGGMIGTMALATPAHPVEVLSFLILGGFIASDVRLSPRLVAMVAIIFGLLHGILNGIALREGPGMYGLIGIAAALFTLVALVAGFAVALRQPWAKVVIRVAGSWVVAIGVLMAGWSLGGPG